MPNIIDHIIVEIDYSNLTFSKLDTTLTIENIGNDTTNFYPPGCLENDPALCADYLGPVGQCTDNLANYIEYAGINLTKESYVVYIDQILNDFAAAQSVTLAPRGQFNHILNSSEKQEIINYGVGFIVINYKMYSGGSLSISLDGWQSTGTLVKEFYVNVDPSMTLGNLGSPLSCCLKGRNWVTPGPPPWDSELCSSFVCLDIQAFDWTALEVYDNPPLKNQLTTELEKLEGVCNKNCDPCIETTPEPTPTLAPTPTPSPTSCELCFRIVCDACLVTPTPTPAVTMPPPPNLLSIITSYYPIPTDQEFWNNPTDYHGSIYNIRKISINEVTNKMYVTSTMDLIFTINLSNNTIINSYSVGTTNLAGIAVNNNNNHYYVLGSDLVDVNANNNTKTILTTIGIGYDIKYEPINNRIYYLSDTGSGFAKLAYWNFSNSSEIVLETFPITPGSGFKGFIDASIHKVFVSLPDLNKIAVINLLTSTTSYIDVYANSRGLAIDNSNKIYLVNSSGSISQENDNSIITIESDNTVSSIWKGEGLKKPTFIKLNKNKNKLYILNQNNSISIYDTITGFNVLTSNMPYITAEFTDLKITTSGKLYCVYNNRIVVFNQETLP